MPLFLVTCQGFESHYCTSSLIKSSVRVRVIVIKDKNYFVKSKSSRIFCFKLKMIFECRDFKLFTKTLNNQSFIYLYRIFTKFYKLKTKFQEYLQFSKCSSVVLSNAQFNYLKPSSVNKKLRSINLLVN